MRMETAMAFTKLWSILLRLLGKPIKGQVPRTQHNSDQWSYDMRATVPPFKDIVPDVLVALRRSGSNDLGRSLDHFARSELQ